jgi:cell division protein FtsW (lipid II flippase)/cell division protein FtsI/penicillin-binding protein 2
LNAIWNEPAPEPVRREARLLGLAFGFILLNTLALLLAPAVRAGSWEAFGRPAWALLVPVVWGASAWNLHRVLNRLHPRRDPLLLPVGLLLAGWGEFLILRLSPTFGLRQLLWLAVGVLITTALLRSPAEMRWLRRYRYLWLAGGLALTALTLLLGTNPSGGEERLWLGCCGVYLQPSEPLRLLLLAYLAAFLADRLAFGWGMQRPGLLAVLTPLVMVWGVSIGVLLAQRDLGTSTLFLGLLAVMLYLASDRWQALLAALVLALTGALAAYGLFDIVQLRVQAWLNPWADPMGGSYQVIQGLIAYASGGLLGRGAGIGSPGLVPIAVSDYIFAVVGEEWGLVGALGLIGLYAVLVQRGLRAATRNADPFRALLAAGIATALGLQTVMILGGVLRLLPVTGITLPFLSYGGSSLLTSFLGLGVLLAVSEGDQPSRFVRPARVVQGVMLLAWAGLALSVGWWTIVRAPVLTARTDNPRRALAERINPRGPIIDRRGLPLAETVGPQGDYQRRYPLGAQAAAAIGYDSAIFAQAGLEQSRDAQLRGEAGHDVLTTWWQHLTQGTPPRGLGLRVTLDAELQAELASALSPYRGAAVVLSTSTGDILAMASSPSFDANTLDAEWGTLTSRADAPLLNRATQGRYQPGMLLAPLLLSVGADAGTLTLDQTVDGLSTAVRVDGQQVGCALTPPEAEQVEGNATYATALRFACPAPLSQLGSRLGAAWLEETITRFGLGETALAELEPAAPTPAEVPGAGPVPALEAIGQGGLGVTPLQMARAYAALRSNGLVPGLRIVSGLQDPGGAWADIAVEDQARRSVGPTAAAAVLRALDREPDGFRAMVASAVTGSGGRRVNWFAGASAEGQPGLVVVVVLENGTLADAWRIGKHALSGARAAVD